MKTFGKISANILVLIIGALLISGCEDSGGGSLSSGHDFGDNNPDVTVAYGDSITYGTGLSGSQSYPAQLSGILGKTVINAGSPGRWASDGVSGISSTLSRHKPGYILVLFGANDLIFSRNADAIVSDLRTIVQAAKNNNTIPIIAALTPVYDGHSFIAGGIDAINPKIKQMAKDEGIKLADLNKAFGSDRSLLQRDGLHPTAAGAAKMAQVFGNIVQ